MDKRVMRARARQERLPGLDATPTYLDLAGDALLAGMTREQVIEHLHTRIKRDLDYLDYRKANGKHTCYDEQVTQDLRALALAIVLLGDVQQQQ